MLRRALQLAALSVLTVSSTGCATVSLLARGGPSLSDVDRFPASQIEAASAPSPLRSAPVPLPSERQRWIIDGTVYDGTWEQVLRESRTRALLVARGGELVLEQAEQNPLLERFYRDPQATAFATQLHFLFQRAQQLAALKQGDLFAPVRVADYLFDKDRLFARITLEDAEFALYEQVHSRLAIEPPEPDLVVFLQAPVDVLMERIARRRIAHERLIERNYLERLNEAYARFFHDYDAAPLLIVNAAAIDPVGNEADFDELLGARNRRDTTQIGIRRDLPEVLIEIGGRQFRMDETILELNRQVVFLVHDDRVKG